MVGARICVHSDRSDPRLLPVSATLHTFPMLVLPADDCLIWISSYTAVVYAWSSALCLSGPETFTGGTSQAALINSLKGDLTQNSECIPGNEIQLFVGTEPKHKMNEAIRCTLVNCICLGFKPGKINPRQCEQCRHGWVAHALSKLRIPHFYPTGQVEIVQSSVVFDISSLMLYGTQAIPIRLKILLDRLFSVLKQEEVIQILHSLDWTLQDYIRGYVLQDASGKVLDHWSIMTVEEELATLQQFLRFGETKSIVELMAIHEKEGYSVLVPSTRANSDIRTFIESSNPRNSPIIVPNPLEKVSPSSIHPFENMINNMAFTLPFQFFSPVPPPLIGSPPERPFAERIQDRGSDGKQDAHISFSESSFLTSSSASFNIENESNISAQDVVTKAEDDSPLSDSSSHNTLTNYEMTSVSPENTLNTAERNGTGPRKGRVFCTACEKTFYDKGTLKIHYNAVHLKIKHRCTIEGCNMVFSSLRSRNRHSSNPNPRLHMPMNRNNRDKDLRNGLIISVSEDHKRLGLKSPSLENRSPNNYVTHNTDSKMPTGLPNVGQSCVLIPNLKTVQPVLPFYRSPVTPAEIANTPGMLPSLPVISSSVSDKMASADLLDIMPKKKSRKSSMPIKIHKESVDTPTESTENISSEEDLSPNKDDSSVFDYSDTNVGTSAESLGRHDRDNMHSSIPFQSQNGDEQNSETAMDKSYDNASSDSENEFHPFTQEPALKVDSSENKYDHLNHFNVVRQLADPSLYIKEQPKHSDSEDRLEFRHYSFNGGIFGAISNKGPGLSDSSDIDQHLDISKDENRFHCEICKKAFKNPYSVKMHYKNVHPKEMHLCTIDGCNAAFPSRRSRDRHSSNLNLHHKLLTRDALELQNSPYNFPYLLKDMANNHYQESPLKNPGQTSVIFKGMNRTGSLVYPMSKIREPCLDSFGTDPVNDSVVLDLSTTSSVKSASSSHSSWDSDGGSEEGNLPVEDRDENFEGLHFIPQEELYHNLNLVSRVDQSFSNIPSGKSMILKERNNDAFQSRGCANNSLY
ncbi:zinc finger protein basonuclin-1 isoform X5 [Dendrobates tinctorius]|uniref:zinc finger protein basonuclin-1 isoform X5 n=1 Tax=Dendrobates tinctorius TaxID=92724 RepID=UPI003CC9A77C